MNPRTRVSIAAAVASLGWMLGYGMGGGFRVGDPDGASARNPAAKGANSGDEQTNGSTVGIARPAVETLADQIARRQGKWTEERLRKSLESMAREPDIFHAIRFALKLSEQLGADDFPMTLKVAKEAGDVLDDSGDVWMMLAMSRWAELDPQAAGEYVRTDKELRTGFIFTPMDALLGSWGVSNPAAAIGWAKSLPEKGEQQRGIKQVLTAVARRDVDEAITLTKTLPPDLLTDGALGSAIDDALRERDPERNARTLVEVGSLVEVKSAAGRWASKNPAEALKWAEELTDEKLRTEALKGVWPEFAARNPEAAAAELSQATEDTAIPEGSSKIVAQKLADEDPQKAARWAASLPQRKSREEAFGALGEFYGEKEPEAAGTWLNGLATGPERDRAVAAFVSKAREKDPAGATDWAVTIRDDAGRIDAVRGALNDWFKASPGAAVEWLQTTPSISEADRQTLLKAP